VTNSGVVLTRNSKAVDAALLAVLFRHGSRQRPSCSSPDQWLLFSRRRAARLVDGCYMINADGRCANATATCRILAALRRRRCLALKTRTDI